jgi:hypothetical protein
MNKKDHGARPCAAALPHEEAYPVAGVGTCSGDMRNEVIDRVRMRSWPRPRFRCSSAGDGRASDAHRRDQGDRDDRSRFTHLHLPSSHRWPRAIDLIAPVRRTQRCFRSPTPPQRRSIHHPAVTRRALVDVEVVAGHDLARVQRADLLEQHVFRIPAGRATEGRPVIKNEQPWPRPASDPSQLD